MSMFDPSGQPFWDDTDYLRDYIWLGIDRSRYTMSQSVIDFIQITTNTLRNGICPACGAAIPLARGRAYTCNDVCHAAWMDLLVQQHGETRPITDLTTGKTHAVPTRVILESGIKGSDLATYPEVTSEGVNRE